MVVHDLDVLRAVVGPAEAEAPLVVDPDAVKAGPVAAQGLQAVAWRVAQVDQVPGRFQHFQLPAGLAFDGAEPADRLILSEAFGVAASEAADH